MLVEFDKECREVGYVDDPDHISLAGRNGEGSCRVVVDNC